MNSRSSSYIQVKENGLQEIITGFAWLIKLAQGDSLKRSALLALPDLKTLEENVTLVLGNGAISGLEAGLEVNVDAILKLTLMTERNPRASWAGPALVIYPSRKLLEMIDRMSGITDILVVSSKIWSIQDWIETWRIAPLGFSPLPPARSAMSPILVAALKTLTPKGNEPAGIAHDASRAAAVSLFESLHHGGFVVNPKQIRKWLVAKGGWQGANADEIQEIAERVVAGKHLKAQRNTWSEGIFQIWRAEERRISD